MTESIAGSIENIRETDMDSEIIELLKNENPEAKRLILGILKNRSKLKEDLESLLKLKS